MKNDLTKIPLLDLHIYKQNAFQTLVKLERVMGGNRQNIPYDFKDYSYFADIYTSLEEEMNDRITNIIGKSNETN